MRADEFGKAYHVALFGTLAGIVGIIANVVVTLVIAQFVMSLLITFNVINMSNDFVSSIYKAINMLLDPILRPIRKMMPDTGAIDFSPIVLIIGLNILVYVLQRASHGVLI